MAEQKFTLVYDSACPLCRKSVDWIVRQVGEEKFHFIPCDSHERKEVLPGLGDEECASAVQLITPQGEVLAGEKALLEILRRNRKYPLLTFFMNLPFIGSLFAKGYRWVAKNRYRISGLLFSARKE